MRFSRPSAMAAAALALSGCLKQTAVIPHFTDRERAEDVRVIDARPASDKDDHFLSLLVCVAAQPG